MFPIRHLIRAGFLSLTSIVTSHATAITLTEPTYDFGKIDTYAVTVDPGHAAGAYAKELTFSLDASADMRFDLRYAGTAYKYYSATVGLNGEKFDLFDNNHQLIGSAGIDGSFTQYGPECGNALVFCRYNKGLTLNTHLDAGSYTIEFSGLVAGYQSPDLHFGVTHNNPAYMNEYLTHVTPTAAIPESSTASLMALGLMSLAFGARKKPTKK